MSRITLVPRTSDLARPGGFLDAEEAFRKLKVWALEADALQHFRAVWERETLGGFGDPPSDRRVLAELAQRLADGRLCLAGPRRRTEAAALPPRKTGAAMPGKPQPKLPAAPQLPGTPDLPLKLRPAPLPQSPALPEAVTDYIRQAQCLVDAAASGAAFVEQCAR